MIAHANDSKTEIQEQQQQEEKLPYTTSESLKALPESKRFIEPTPEEIRLLVRKQDRVLMPLMMLIYLFFDLGGITLGNSKLAGLMEDIDITEDQFNWAASVFSFGFILCEVPANIILQRIGARRWLALTMFLTSIILASISAVHNGQGLIAGRFFLGCAQAGVFPGLVYYVSLWYTRKEQGARMAWFLVMGSVGSAIGGIIAYGIMHMDYTRGLRAWRWIFILIACPTFLAGCIVFSFLPDTPEKQKRFLSPREQAIAVYRLNAEKGAATEEKFSWERFRAVFTDWKTYAFASIQITCMVPIVSLGVFMPSIVRGMGFSNLTAQGMSAPPWVAAAIGMVLVSWYSDRLGERGLHVFFSCMLAVVGYLLLIVLVDHGWVALYVSAIIATFGVFASNPPRVAWNANNFGDPTKKGIAIAFTSSCASIGSVIGGQVYRGDDAPLYKRGHAIALAFIGLSGLLSLLLKYLLRRENKRRETLSVEQYEKESHKIGDDHPDYRFIH
ncbi:major facilitator superfamily domain-containing protein [Zychaea mexicana]|uniref:major facilitator superfamily domain-containing protein n=1 Tax=Zychaea mexicana TaxID=64656 RepID=UPI0022FEEA4E|nr:major facilitator superfamily domain-containing protein [Zychaea mexicana]KAI9482623.1 major facilitator superfamily domain-containing protein [Zychaea mexicana]